MRTLYLAAALIGGLSISVDAQLNIKVPTNEPVTGLDSETWAILAKKIVNAVPIVGKPEVYMVNATPESLTVNCDRWELVGQSPYIADNPKTLPPWTVTLVNAKGFDGYCKNGLAGQTASDDVYGGVLNARDHSFSDSTFVTFSAKNKQ